ncbi:phage holin family protein [Sphingorhabdus arenilitoris]|uniref:Phage holin family protein n=1 Tax=Sphingorhabdus arenilitoris TaxID=1490041 RepID=A0ABV8RFM0_9SPHN
MDGDPDQTHPLDIDDVQPNAADPSIKRDMEQLAHDVRQFASAEIDYYRARLNYSKSVAKRSALFFTISLIALLGGSIAFILGCLLILVSYAGPVVATLIVVGACVVVSIGAALIGRKQARKFKFPEIESEDDGSD